MSEDFPTLVGNAPQRARHQGFIGRNRRRGIWTIVLLLAAGGLIYALRPSAAPQKSTGGRHGGPQGGVMPIAAAVATKGDIGITLAALGTVTPLATVTVHTQIAGLLMQLGFSEGQVVKKGDFLAQIDSRPYQAQLAQFEGQLAKDEAALKDAQLNLKRYQTLVKEDSLARQTLDTQVATVHQDEGAIKTDRAQIDTAKLNLVYCRITAPVSGRVGLRQVDVGNYVQTSDANGLVVITQLQPISAIFVLPEDNIDQVQRRLATGAKLPVTAFDRTDSTALAAGVLETIDNQIDITTGTVKLRALFDNRDNALFPNQFVNVRLLVDTVHDTVVIPSAAVQRGAPGTFVYLVNADNTVAVRPVTLGPVDGQNVAVSQGLNPGDKIVIDGTDKLKDGAKVTIPAEHPAEQKPDTASTGGNAKKNGGDGKSGDDGRHHHGHGDASGTAK